MRNQIDNQSCENECERQTAPDIAASTKAIVSQDELQRIKALREVSKELASLTAQLKEKLMCGAEVEPGRLNVEIRQVMNRSF